jgi:hypothetical protein
LKLYNIESKNFFSVQFLCRLQLPRTRKKGKKDFEKWFKESSEFEQDGGLVLVGAALDA